MTASLWSRASAQPARRLASIGFEQSCALHYTFTRLPCKRCGMDKRILAHQFVHFIPGQKLERRDLRVSFHSEMPGLSGLVDLSNSVRSGVR